MSDKAILVGGEWRIGRGPAIKAINPANGDILCTFNGADITDVNDAIDAAKQAMSEPAWRDLKPVERAQYLYRIAELLSADAKRIAELQTLDTGKCLTETLALVNSAVGTFRYVAAALETLDDTLTSPRGDYFTMSVYEPMGVIAAITPWNSPIASEAQKVAPALAGGNAVILKPAESSSLVALELGKICLAAGLPKALISVLPGRGSVVGNAMVKHPDIKKVSFTGGTSTGRRIAEMAARKLMPVSLELGGKSPTIVFEDADIDHAVNGVMYGIFSSTGQSCIAGSRLFVQQGIYNRFVEQLITKTKQLRVGLPTDSRTQVAPMASFEHRDSVAGYVDLARSEGATVLCGGEIPSGGDYDKGAFYLPTILTGLDNQTRTCREEIFGPVLVVLPFNDEEDLVKQANDSDYGLACGLWTENYKKAYRLARRIEAGTVWINTYKQFSISTPFTGIKDSGMGKEKGREGIREYMQQKSLYWGLNPTPLAWAEPR